MSAPAGAVRDFSMLQPPGWVRLPLDDRLPLRVRSLVAERVSDVPARHRAQVRASVTRELTSALDSAARRGGIDVLLSVDPVAGQAVPASCLVSHLEGPGEDVLDMLVSSPGPTTHVLREVGVVAVAGGRAVRRLSTVRDEVPADGGMRGGVLTATQLEYVVPLPAGDGLLVLTFSTPIERLGPPLVRLFDVMARSLRWVMA